MHRYKVIYAPKYDGCHVAYFHKTEYHSVYFYGHLPSRISLKSKEKYRRLKQILTLRLLMSYIYGAPILDVSRSHTTTQHSR